MPQPAAHDLRRVLRRFVARSGEPVVRQAVTAAMRILARQFVMGRTIEEALDARGGRASKATAIPTTCSARRRTPRPTRRAISPPTSDAIAAIGPPRRVGESQQAPGISVKLSALHPRYEMAQRERVLRELVPRLLALARRAREAGIGFTIDAEEADRLDLSLDLIEALALAPDARRLGRARPCGPGLSEARACR